MNFSKDLIKLDCEQVTCRLIENLRQQVFVKFKRHGGIVGISGGIDSSVMAALSARAFGPEKMLGIIMPDRDNTPQSKQLAEVIARKYGFKCIVHDISSALEGAGCYRLRNDGFRQVFPEWEEGWKAKIVLPSNILETGRLNVYRLAVESPDGRKMEKRIPVKAYLQIVAASNMKQRMRMLTVYYYAEANNYAVIGTANKNEYYQGFFVKYGDGGVDAKPLVEFYKTQIYQLGEYLGIPEEILGRTPSAETYPSEVSQEEFFFGLKFATMDLLWFAREKGFPVAEVASVMNLTTEQVERVWNDIDQKQRTTEFLRMPPLGIGD